jgi:hypothetical protein
MDNRPTLEEYDSDAAGNSRNACQSIIFKKNRVCLKKV